MRIRSPCTSNNNKKSRKKDKNEGNARSVTKPERIEKQFSNLIGHGNKWPTWPINFVLRFNRRPSPSTHSHTGCPNAICFRKKMVREKQTVIVVAVVRCNSSTRGAHCVCVCVWLCAGWPPAIINSDK